MKTTTQVRPDQRRTAPVRRAPSAPSARDDRPAIPQARQGEPRRASTAVRTSSPVRVRPPRSGPSSPQPIKPATKAVSAAQAIEELDRPAPRAPFIMLVLALVVAGMVGLVLLNTAVNENAFQLHELNKNKKELDMREQQLRRDVAELESAGALDAASKRLNLVDAGAPAFIKLPNGEVSGVPTPAGR